LEWALELKIDKYRDLVEFRSGHLWANKVAELKELDRLLSLVSSGNWPIQPDHSATTSIRKWARSMLDEVENGWRPERWHPDLKGKAPINLLVGYLLLPVFEAYFRRPASGTPTGPYARFVMAVLREFDIKKSDGSDYGAETIKAAVNDARQGYSRRNGCRVSEATESAEDIARFVPPHNVPPF
jgi:hypothetical protein